MKTVKGEIVHDIQEYIKNEVYDQDPERAASYFKLLSVYTNRGANAEELLDLLNIIKNNKI